VEGGVTLICDLLIPNHNKKQCIINDQYMKIFNGITGFHLIVVTDKRHTHKHAYCSDHSTQLAVHDWHGI